MDFIIFHNSTVTTVTGGQKNTIRKNIKSSSFEKVSCAESHLSQLTKSLPNPVTSVTVNQIFTKSCHICHSGIFNRKFTFY